MLNKLRERRDNESGFTLIELLVVILIIGILAAIALPAFLGQQAKAQDSSAKSNARNAVSQVESCLTNESLANCVSGGSADALTGTNIPTTGAEAVTVAANATGGGYNVVAKSKSKSTATFTINKADAGTTRTCSEAGKGGCKADSTW